MSTFLSKSSSTAEVVAWLRENNFDDEVINNFEGRTICLSLSWPTCRRTFYVVFDLMISF